MGERGGKGVNGKMSEGVREMRNGKTRSNEPSFDVLHKE